VCVTHVKTFNIHACCFVVFAIPLSVKFSKPLTAQDFDDFMSHTLRSVTCYVFQAICR